MNRLLDRLPGTPMYLLWGEKVRWPRLGYVCWSLGIGGLGQPGSLGPKGGANAVQLLKGICSSTDRSWRQLPCPAGPGRRSPHHGCTASTGTQASHLAPLLARPHRWPPLQDPWCVPARATQIQRYYPAAERTDINSGHW